VITGDQPDPDAVAPERVEQVAGAELFEGPAATLPLLG